MCLDLGYNRLLNSPEDTVGRKKKIHAVLDPCCDLGFDHSQVIFLEPVQFKIYIPAKQVWYKKDHKFTRLYVQYSVC